MPLDDTLAGIELLSELSKRELRNVARLMTPVRVPAGKVLTREGDPGREFMIIVEGEATVHRRGQLLARIGPGDFFGELSLVAGVPRTATVTAATDMTLETLNRREFSSMLDESPRLAKKVLVGAVQHLHAIKQDAGP